MNYRVTLKRKVLKTVAKMPKGECGDDLIIITDPDEEFVDAQETSWYKNIKSELTPGQVL
ncbi:hypothetical protein [Desulfobacter sp.]|jgi:hypothetical protein|uniref:hypothetical protein n=1 Tax=Desulfobacter sp. TaxID=2294 RepID=UPI003D09D317